MEFRILGPVEVHSGRTRVEIGGARRRALLGLFLTRPNQVVATERIVEELWEGSPPPRAISTLQSHISALRKAIGPDRLISRASGYVLEIAVDDEVDASAFEREVAAGRQAAREGEQHKALAFLRQGLARWRGPALGALASARWAGAEASRLEELRLVAIEMVLDAQLAVGEDAEVVGLAEATIAEHPLRERLWAALMTALYRAGRQSDALRAYQRLRTHLIDELGIEPSPELRALEREVLTQSVSLGERSSQGSPAPRPRDTRATQDRPPATASPVASDVRQRLTMLFCDLAGSTDLSTKIDPEDLKDIIDEYRAIFERIIGHFGGHVSNMAGDDAVAIFGYPVVHEDDARRAVYAGLALAAAVDDLSPRLGQGVEVKARIGIHTGLTVVVPTDVGGRPDVLGETPNLASRLQAVAQTGSVAISETTAALVRGWFDVSSLGTPALKGVHRPVEVFRVLGLTEAESRIEAADGTLGELIGRDAERAALAAAWNRATVHEEATAVLIAGEPGIGKSRLVEYAKQLAAQSGVRPLVLYCSPYHVHSALHPVRRLVERAAGIRDVENPSDRYTRLAAFLAGEGLSSGEEGVLAALLAVPLPDNDPRPEFVPDQLRERTFAALASWLEQMTTRTPVMLAVEDIHWADETTKEFLRRFLDRSSGRRTFTVLTARGHVDLHTGAEVPVLDLRPLEPADRAMMLDTLAGGHHLSATVRQAVIERSDGIPLYIQELTSMFSPTGQAPNATAGVTDEALVPVTLNDLLLARLEQHADAKHLAQVVATAGQPVTTGLLHAVTALDKATIRDQLDRLVDGGLLFSSGTESDPAFAFRHVLVRDVAYLSQLRSRRREVHLALAQAIEAQDPLQAKGQPEVVAYHYQHGGAPVMAARYWYEAGHLSAAIGAHAEAVEHFSSAVAVLQGLTDPEVLALDLDAQSALALSLTALRGYASADVAKAYDRARDLAARVGGTSDQVARLFGLWAYYSVRGEHRVALELARAALEAAEATVARDDILQAKAQMGYQEFFLGHLEDARTMLEEAAAWQLGVVGRVPHDPGVASVINLAPVQWMLGFADQAELVMADALARAEVLDFPIGPFTRAFSGAFAAWFCQLKGDAAAAARHATRTIEISAEYGFPSWLGAGMMHLAIANSVLGPPGDAIPLITYGLAAWREAGAELFRSYFLYGLADARDRAGDPAGALSAIDEALDHAQRYGERFMEAELRRRRGMLILEIEPEGTERAADEFNEAIRVATDQRARMFELRARTALHCLRVAQARGDETAAELEALMSWFSEGDNSPDLVAARAALSAGSR